MNSKVRLETDTRYVDTCVTVLLCVCVCLSLQCSLPADQTICPRCREEDHVWHLHMVCNRGIKSLVASLGGPTVPNCARKSCIWTLYPSILQPHMQVLHFLFFIFITFILFFFKSVGHVFQTSHLFEENCHQLALLTRHIGCHMALSLPSQVSFLMHLPSWA